MVSELRGKVPPEVEERLERAVETFRSNHRHPANLALHAVAVYFIAKGAFRLLRGRWFRGLELIGMGVALILVGHQIEGSDSFSVFKSSGDGRIG